MNYNLLVTVVCALPVVAVMVPVIRRDIRDRAHLKRMDQYAAWLKERVRLKELGQLSAAEEAEVEHYAMKCLLSPVGRGVWDYRGPWEKSR